jgi:hypothetical protein
VFISALAGDRLDHRLVGVSNHEPCPRVLALVRTRWLVVLRRTFLMVPPLEVHRCLPGVRPAFEDAGFTAYRPLAG